MNQTIGLSVVANSQDEDGYEVRAVLQDAAKQIPTEKEHMTDGDVDKCESVNRTGGTMEAISEFQRRNELEIEGKIRKDNLK